MSADNSSDLFSYVDSETFRKILREQVLEYEYINGRKIVSPTYALKMEAVDPKSIQALTENNGTLSDLKAHLLNINVKRAILEEIALINSDVTQHVNHYLNVANSFGFKAVGNNEQDINTSNRKETYYHHPVNGSMLVLNTEEDDTVHSAVLFCQGKIIDREIFNNVKSQTIPLTQAEGFCINVDVKELLSSKMECLLKSVKFNRNWESLTLPHPTYKHVNEIKKSLNLLDNPETLNKSIDVKTELDKKITHRTKRTLQ